MNSKELKQILEEGEGYKIEFKESLSGLDKEIVAFANASGGRIFLGISDDKKIKGVSIDNALKSQIQDIANNCDPSIKIIFEEFENILIINVREGDDKPYRCSAGFYTRVGPNSQKLNRDEIIAFIKSEGKIRFDEFVNLEFDYKKHFDHNKFEKFLKLGGITKLIDTPTLLVNLGVAEKQEGKLIFNNTGILFFAKNLQNFYPHAGVTCALYKGTEKVEVLDRKDFNEDIVFNVDSAMNFLKQYIPVRYEMTGTPQRRELPEIPYDAIREAIINAVAHRDYFEKGSNVMVEMFDDRIEITDFGGLPKGLKPEDFGKRSVLRNPNIANLLHRIKYIEKMGTGISKIRRLVKEAGLPPVKFEFDTFFTVTFKRPKHKPFVEEKRHEEFGIKFGKEFGINEGISEGINEGINEGIKNRLLQEILYIKKYGFFTRRIIERLNKISTSTAERDITLLKKKGIIKFEGSKKTGRYVLTDKGKKLLNEEL
jgi:ATP-dependent DNA helicase RecG